MLASILLNGSLHTTVHAEPISLTSSDTVATAGYYQLRWHPDKPGSQFLLYESSSKDFITSRLVYRGTDLATVISGRADDVYFYRVSSVNDNPATSNTVKVTVRHHPLSLAIQFFMVGAMVFLATLILIITGYRNTR